ncbi:MAG: formate--tetrahydrofolate ligase, partial [Alphaproteobacteria bacterium]
MSEPSFSPDLDIARAARLHPIQEIAASLGIPPEAVFRYGPHKAKIALDFA